MTQAPDLNDLRAQRDALDRQVAEATIDPAEELMALLGGEEVTRLLDRLAVAAAPLDEATRRRVEQWAKMREAMTKLGLIELARMRKLVG